MVRLPDNLLGAVAPIADAIAPSVDASVTGSSGIVTLIANASDNVGVSDVEFMVDGVLTSNDPNSPYTLDIDSTALANGNHTLSRSEERRVGNEGDGTGRYRWLS